MQLRRYAIANSCLISAHSPTELRLCTHLLLFSFLEAHNYYSALMGCYHSRTRYFTESDFNPELRTKSMPAHLSTTSGNLTNKSVANLPVQHFRTGDMFFFRTRTAAAPNDKTVWDSCAVLLAVPQLWGAKAMLLEFNTDNNHRCYDAYTGSIKAGGMRLVPFTKRMSADDYSMLYFRAYCGPDLTFDPTGTIAAHIGNVVYHADQSDLVTGLKHLDELALANSSASYSESVYSTPGDDDVDENAPLTYIDQETGSVIVHGKAAPRLDSNAVTYVINMLDFAPELRTDVHYSPDEIASLPHLRNYTELGPVPKAF